MLRWDEEAKKSAIVARGKKTVEQPHGLSFDAKEIVVLSNVDIVKPKDFKWIEMRRKRIGTINEQLMNVDHSSIKCSHYTSWGNERI